jgi:hypothetical protein
MPDRQPLTADDLGDRSRFRFKPGEPTIGAVLRDPRARTHYARKWQRAIHGNRRSVGRAPRARSNHRRKGSRRASGVRSGQDPGDPDADNARLGPLPLAVGR